MALALVAACGQPDAGSGVRRTLLARGRSMALPTFAVSLRDHLVFGEAGVAGIAAITKLRVVSKSNGRETPLPEGVALEWVEPERNAVVLAEYRSSGAGKRLMEYVAGHGISATIDRVTTGAVEHLPGGQHLLRREDERGRKRLWVGPLSALEPLAPDLDVVSLASAGGRIFVVGSLVAAQEGSWGVYEVDLGGGPPREIVAPGGDNIVPLSLVALGCHASRGDCPGGRSLCLLSFTRASLASGRQQRFVDLDRMVEVDAGIPAASLRGENISPDGRWIVRPQEFSRLVDLCALETKICPAPSDQLGDVTWTTDSRAALVFDPVPRTSGVVLAGGDGCASSILDGAFPVRVAGDGLAFMWLGSGAPRGVWRSDLAGTQHTLLAAGAVRRFFPWGEGGARVVIERWEDGKGLLTWVDATEETPRERPLGEAWVGAKERDMSWKIAEVYPWLHQQTGPRIFVTASYETADTSGNLVDLDLETDEAVPIHGSVVAFLPLGDREVLYVVRARYPSPEDGLWWASP